ncbi:PREDICTED: sushi, von Willebrand factor type A, EGF and pentraxin domain-containing protein 1-like isoform X1 [Branchiostoma belcheri]|uniref:Sushi, von Willebrand factor type A, EGF and pentraxin domain-containing protein 1-like isoform X1 n=1 Tax=Branchiostoma belcheri TaxID=7741 RepID=A0A6P4XX36_BRABE|nr:PREDICTED: sushi, von Willebrand factor type A, EGF and pentraxin domain-containing protein 1-like isoform X1 [Branchiostoma belcheri]
MKTCTAGRELPAGVFCNPRTTDIGQWDGKDISCIPVRCDPLPPPYRGRVSCTDDYNFLSECTYSCDEGFDIPSGMNRVRVCTAAAEWTGREAQCKDIIRPRIVDCPGPLLIEYLDMNDKEVTVIWVEPSVSDNADPGLTADLSEGKPPGSSFPVGTHRIVYTATDTAGNAAIPCEFTVSVREITCPEVKKKPYQLVSCPGGNSYGSRCEFSCEDGARLIGTNFSYCGKTGDPPVGYWDWDLDQLEDSQPKCEGHPCRSLRVPQNGALACDAWLYGKYCTMLCNTRYDIPPGLRIRNSLWVCGSSGNWDYPDPPHCSERRRPSSMRLPSELQYFAGDCGSSDTQEQISENFVQIFQDSGFGSICAHLSCTVENVNVICGSTSRRKRDDTQTNSSETSVLTIQFDFALPISDEISVYESEQVLYSLADETSRQVLSGNLTMKNVTGVELVLNQQSFKSGLSEFQCPDGMEPRYDTFSCIGCSAGTFYNSMTKNCQECPIGTFQDEDSQFDCKRCPHGYTTVAEGANNETVCRRECRPGTFSSNGVQPCSPCNRGEYQPTMGETSCISCPPATTTLFEGEADVSACENFDLQFPRPSPKVSGCVIYDDVEFKNASGITVSFWVWFHNSCHPNASMFHFYCLDTSRENWRNETTQYPCFYMSSPQNIRLGLRRKNETTEIQTGVSWRHETWHHVGVVYSATNSTYMITVDGKAVANDSFSQQLLHEGISQHGPLWLGCHITEGTNGTESFAGFISNVNIWSHAKNESDLLDMARTCVNKNAGDVLSWSQLATAKQLKVSLQIPSLCDDTDECASAPCGDNQCVDQLRDYSCICKTGFIGQNCEINIDDCEDNVCQNNATCLDGVGNYTCLCSEGFVGDFCEVESVDGNWAPWSQWSSCSASCGGGNHSRTRECINPRPMHGGSNCTGPSFEIGACNTQNCPVCKNLTDPVNGFATCNSTGEEIYCTISCKPGFEFYDQPNLHYHCGQSTLHQWNHETPRNPMARYPPCTEVTPPKALDVKHEMTYSNLSCKTEESARLAKLEVEKTIQTRVKDIECVKRNSCYVRAIDVEHCSGQTVESDKVTVTVELSSISVAENETNNTDKNHSSTAGNLAVTITELELAALQLENMTFSDDFTVFIHNDAYPVDNNATKTYGVTECSIGEIVVMFYCVPCPIGTSFNNGKCIKCDKGTYQNETGQVNCITCPTGLTTEGFGAFDEEDCLVLETAVSTEEPVTQVVGMDSKMISIAAGTAGALGLIFLISFAVLLQRYLNNRAKVSNESRMASEHEKKSANSELEGDHGRLPTQMQMKQRKMYLPGEENLKSESKV